MISLYDVRLFNNDKLNRILSTFTLSAIRVHRVLRLVHWDIFFFGICFRSWMLVMVAIEWCLSLSSGTVGSVMILFAATRKWMISSEFYYSLNPSNIFSRAPSVFKRSVTEYARIFVLAHYLFLTAHSFPQATLLHNKVMSADKYLSIFSMPKGDCCLYAKYINTR